MCTCGIPARFGDAFTVVFVPVRVGSSYFRRGARRRVGRRRAERARAGDGADVPGARLPLGGRGWKPHNGLRPLVGGARAAVLPRVLYTSRARCRAQVDLRADADCDLPGLERCHPRYVAGHSTEVQLWSSSAATARAEHIRAYCDVWGRGRLENALLYPRELQRVLRRAEARREALFGPPSASGSSLDVLVVLLHGVSMARSRSALPKTLGWLGALNASGTHELASFDRHRPVSTRRDHNLRTLIRGAHAPRAKRGRRGAARADGASSLWDAYRHWGYLTAYVQVPPTPSSRRVHVDGVPPNAHRPPQAGCDARVSRSLGFVDVPDGSPPDASRPTRYPPGTRLHGDTREIHARYTRDTVRCAPRDTRRHHRANPSNAHPRRPWPP